MFQQKFAVDRVDLKKLKNTDVKRVRLKSQADLQLGRDGEFNRAGGKYQDMKMSAKESHGYFELKFHKIWFDEEYSKFVGLIKQAKLLWLYGLR
jgi:hypothetical protein